MKKTLLSFSLLVSLSFGAVFAQQTQRCGTTDPGPEWDKWFNKLVEKTLADQSLGKMSSSTTYTIPVVVHIIHSGEAVGTGTNISQTQVNSQITVLNADYNGTGLNVGNCPSIWTSLIANSGIVWCLTTKDPNGNTMAEPGIDRIHYTSIAGLSAPGGGYSIPTVDGTIKPATIWDPNKYCNIWVMKLGGGILGYALFPAASTLSGLSGTGTATTDGAAIHYSSFGNTGNVIAPYNKGRTASHELGHWLGLRHIWGDGNCNTDYVNDTPYAATANYSCSSGCSGGCFTFPYDSGGCGLNTTGEMTMNFMDYTDDLCMYMFTNGQKARFVTALANATYRKNLSLYGPTECALVGIDENNLYNYLSVFPNPSSGVFTFNFNLPHQYDMNFSVTNILGQTVLTRSVKGLQNQNVQLDLSEFGKGIYFVSLVSSDGNKAVKKVIVE